MTLCSVGLISSPCCSYRRRLPCTRTCCVLRAADRVARFTIARLAPIAALNRQLTRPLTAPAKAIELLEDAYSRAAPLQLAVRPVALPRLHLRQHSLITVQQVAVARVIATAHRMPISQN